MFIVNLDFVSSLWRSIWANKWSDLALKMLLGTLLHIALLPAYSLASERMISLSPHLTELVFELGAGDRLVGTVAFSDYPKEAGDVPVIGSSSGINMEAVIALSPDLILAWPRGNSPIELDQLTRMGLRVERFSPENIADIPDDIERLGALLNRANEGRRLSAYFRTRLSQLKQHFQPTPKVFYQVWHDPLMTQNGATLISEAIEWCGGVNPFADLAVLAPVVSKEAVIAADPDWIVTGSQGDELRSGRDLSESSGLSTWTGLPLKAVGLNQLAEVPVDWLHRPTMRFLQGIEAVCEIVSKTKGVQIGEKQ